MVARKRFNSLSLGAETAQKVSGFSRIRPEVFSQNKHSGLYFASNGRKLNMFDVNGAYIKRSVRKIERNTSVKAKRASQKVRKFARSCNFEKSRSGQQFTEPERLFINPRMMNRPVKCIRKNNSSRKLGKSPPVKNQSDIQDALLNFKLRGVLQAFEKSFVKVHGFEMSRKQYLKKLESLNEMIWTSKEIGAKASKARAILISNQVSIEKAQIRENLRLKAVSRTLKRELKGLQNLRRHKKGYFQDSIHGRNLNILHMHHLFKARESRDRFKHRHVVDYGCGNCSTVPHFKEDCITVESKSRINQRNFQFANMATETVEKEPPKFANLGSRIWKSLGNTQGNPAPSHVTMDEKNEKDSSTLRYVPPTLNQSTDGMNLSHEINQMVNEFESSNAPIISDTNSLLFAVEGSTESAIKDDDLNAIASDVSLLTENKGSSDSGEEYPTPQTTNFKSLKLKGEGDMASMSSIHNSSSVHKVKLAQKGDAEKEKNFISSDPNDKPLREDGNLPPFPDLESVMQYFEPFMLKLLDFIEKIKKENDPQLAMSEMEDVAVFILSTISRIVFKDETHKIYFDVLESNVDDMIAMGQEELKWREASDIVNTSSWSKRKNEMIQQQAEAKLKDPLSSQTPTKTLKSTSQLKGRANPIVTFSQLPTTISSSPPNCPASSSTAPVASGNAPDGGDGDDDSHGDDNDSGNRKKQSSSRRSNKKKRSDKKKKNSSEDDSSSSDNESDSAFSDGEVANDELYRKILRELMKTAKNYKIKELSMHPDPALRREKFNIWVIDLRNILSTHSQTLGLLDDFPAELPSLTYNVDRAIKALLSSVTVGMAKQLVANASSAFQALLDLRRNFGQTSSFDIHRESVKMMLMKQSSNEKASEFLRRVRKQINACTNVGCMDYVEHSASESNIVNIVLGGLDSSNRFYAATIAELKARYRAHPQSITFIDLEELFFNLDDSIPANRSTHSRREHANYIVGGGDKKKDMSKVKCYRCGKMGHFAKTCKVTQNKSKNSPSSNNGKKDLSSVKCFKCGQLGHYANRCPNEKKSNSSVSFESAHVAKEGEESCKVCLESESGGNIRNFENIFCFKFQNVHPCCTAATHPSYEASIGATTFSLNSKECNNCLLDDVNAINEDGVNRSNFKVDKRNINAGSRVQQKNMQQCEPDCHFSNRHTSMQIQPFDSGIVLSENIDLRGHFCRAKLNRNKYFKSYSRCARDDFSPWSRCDVRNKKVRGARKGQNSTEYCYMASMKVKRQNQIALAYGDLAKWLFDSGATSHFTPFIEDLVNPEKLDKPLCIRVADGSTLKATHRGLVHLNFTADQGMKVNLRLLRVLFVPGLQTRLFSIESFISDGKNRVEYKQNVVRLIFQNGITMSIELPHQPPSTFTSVESSLEDQNQMEINEVPSIPVKPSKHDPSLGGESAPTWESNDWEEQNWNLKGKRRMNVELAHDIFGHRAVSSLLMASKANVWDDVTMVAGEDSWCESCRIATAPKTARSKSMMRFKGKPLEHMFVDLVPAPGQMRGIKGYNETSFLFLVDPISRFVSKINMSEKSAKNTISALIEWRKDMVKQGYPVFFYLRSDAGSNFTADSFKKWCKKESITLTIAGPHHQEQNAFAESTYRVCSKMARSMLAFANLPIEFFHFAIDYAIMILRVLPPKNLVDERGNPITTYQLLHHVKPRISRFKVFGCPVVFKRYQPFKDNKMVTDFKQVQQGSRGIFVGFPSDQAGWLIYVPEKIQNSHLVVSMDVAFDQTFMSGAIGTNKPFAQAQPERHVGKHGGNRSEVSESTGDITSLTTPTISHWGRGNTYDATHSSNTNMPSSTLIDNIEPSNDSVDESSNNFDDMRSVDSDDESEPVAPKEFQVDLNAGSQQIDGFRRSKRLGGASSALELLDPIVPLDLEMIMTSLEEGQSAFQDLSNAAQNEDVPIDPYIPEPKSLQAVLRLPKEIQIGWIKAIVKELKFVIENGTFRRGETPVEGDEVVPSMLVFKAKITSRGFLDKLKARCVARGDLQQVEEDPDNLWSPCVFTRTFKMFVAEAVKRCRPINQLDFIGAFCQGLVKERLFLQLPQEYAYLLPEYKEYFETPQLLVRSIYGLNVAAKVWNQDLTEWLTSNTVIPFKQSEVDASLFIHRNGNEFIFLIIYVDDCLYFGSSKELEQRFEKEMSERFKLEVQGWTHWFLGTRLYREQDGSYLLDQENYIKHILSRYCGKDSPWGLPPMQKTPAPVNYVFSKDNRPKSSEEREEIKSRFKGLSMASAVSSLLYAALNTRPDILWITNKLAKSSNDPGMVDFEALMHVFGYLRTFPDYALKFYSDASQSPAVKICKKYKIEPTEIIGFSDTSWQDCPDTGRSTSGYKIFVQGGLVDAQSTMPVPVALSSAEAEYMGACNLGAMVCHLRDLKYEFEKLGCEDYDVEGSTSSVPSILLIDNQATVRMSKNYKVTGKNRHVGRRWHFVRQGVRDNLFSLNWISGEDQLADDCTKSQEARKSYPHFERTLIRIPDRVKGFRSTVIGNR